MKNYFSNYAPDSIDALININIVYIFRDLLEKNLSKKDMKLVLEFNDQQVPSGESRVSRFSFSYPPLS